MPAAFLASGLTSFICPSSAPTTSTGDMPPISSVICFQLQPFSRLMSRIFSVSSSRRMGVRSLGCGLREDEAVGGRCAGRAHAAARAGRIRDEGLTAAG